MLDQQLKGSVSADIIKDEQYNIFKEKTIEEINSIASRYWREYYIYPDNKNTPDYTISIVEDESSGNLVIKYSDE